MQKVQSLFSIETITTYTNSEYIPQTKIACSTQCGPNCEIYIYLKVINILNELYECNCNMYDSEYCIYSTYNTSPSV